MSMHDKCGVCVEKPDDFGLLLSVQDEAREKNWWELRLTESCQVV